MDKLKKMGAAAVQKLSNMLELAAIPLLFEKKRNLTVEKDIKYWQTKHSLCDFYYINDGQKKPVMIYIHGGGFISGTKRLRKYYCYRYAKRGFFVMNTHYDYAPQKQFPFQLHQLFKAVEFLLDNKDRLNIDTDKIALAGESAGAYFCAYLAAIAKNPSLYADLNIDFKYQNDFDVKCLILLNGAFDAQRLAVSKFLNMGLFLHSFFDMPREDLLKEKNKEKTKYFFPLNYINQNFPPCALVKGAHDELGQDTDSFARLLTDMGVPCVSATAKGLVGIHGFCLAVKTKEGKRCLDIVMDFVNKTLNIAKH